MGDFDAGWDSIDAWVLAAIGVHRRRCTLVELIASADWINHAVLLEGEVNSALGKLVGSGLVRVFDDWTFELTDDGSSLWPDGARDPVDQLRFAEEGLSDIAPSSAPVKLPDGAMDDALEQYRRGRHAHSAH